MRVPSQLSHVAMSVPEGTLTGAYRAEVLSFYGGIFGWSEMESLRRPDRLTIAVGRSSYINIRERRDSMVCHGYEHFGILVGSAEDLRRLWTELSNEQHDIELEPLAVSDVGEGSFRFRHLLPMAVEVQYYAALSAATAG